MLEENIKIHTVEGKCQFRNYGKGTLDVGSWRQNKTHFI